MDPNQKLMLDRGETFSDREKYKVGGKTYLSLYYKTWYVLWNWVEYRSMALASYELVWIKQLLQELKFCEVELKNDSDNKKPFILPPIHNFIRKPNAQW